MKNKNTKDIATRVNYPRLKSRVSLLKVMKDLISRRKAIETLNDHQNEYDEYYKGLGKAKKFD